MRPPTGGLFAQYLQLRALSSWQALQISVGCLQLPPRYKVATRPAAFTYRALLWVDFPSFFSPPCTVEKGERSSGLFRRPQKSQLYSSFSPTKDERC